ncbi:MAG: citrate transporter [Spirochaetaceae bacterium]|jgi:Na+/H+ antiporter NhaD/arsenite permease-like protein|nr:citrate transporter [Spirochaetaceae bacterium]
MLEIKIIVLAITVLMYAVVIVFQNKKAHATLGAAVLILLLENFLLPKSLVGTAGITFAEAVGSLISWSVLLIYIGSLAIAELFIYSRMPARIADNIVCGAPNSGVAIVIILIVTGVISAFVENVATVLVMAPIALALSKKINIKPTYFMAGLAVMSNLEGTATLVGDPPSMIFASFANYGFNDFFFSQGRLSIFFFVQIGLLAGVAFFYFLFARQGRQKITVEKETVVSLVPSILFIIMIAGLACCSFVLGEGVSMEAGILVLLLGAAGVLWYAFVRKEGAKNTWKLVKGLDWETILFLIGIFVVIGALERTGVLQDFAGILDDVIGGSVFLGFLIILAVSIIISGFVDNVPYIIAMLPVAKTLSENLSLAPELFMFALLIGSCLGGNLTPFGASANIVAMGILKKEGVPFNFAGWIKIGLPFTVITTFAAALGLWLVWR